MSSILTITICYNDYIILSFIKETNHKAKESYRNIKYPTIYYNKNYFSYNNSKGNNMLIKIKYKLYVSFSSALLTLCLFYLIKTLFHSVSIDLLSTTKITISLLNVFHILRTCHAGSVFLVNQSYWSQQHILEIRMIIVNRFVAIGTRNEIHRFYKYGRGAEV